MRVTPRAARASVGGVREGELLVRVTAPPVEGAANLAVRRTLAEALGIALSELVLEAGPRGRSKLVSAPASARAALARLAQGPSAK